MTLWSLARYVPSGHVMKFAPLERPEDVFRLARGRVLRRLVPGPPGWFLMGLEAYLWYTSEGGPPVPDPMQYDDPAYWELDGWIENEAPITSGGVPIWPMEYGDLPFDMSGSPWFYDNRVDPVDGTPIYTKQVNTGPQVRGVVPGYLEWNPDDWFLGWGEGVQEVTANPLAFPGIGLTYKARMVVTGPDHGYDNSEAYFYRYSWIWQTGATALYVGDFVPGTGTVVRPLPISPFRMPNPNEQRWNAPVTTVPLEAAAAVPKPGLHAGSRILEVTNDPAPEPDLVKVRTRKAPPGALQKERKAFSSVRGFGALLARALDAVSEASEVVDAIYEALPDDVRMEWERRIGAHWIKTWNGKWKWHVPSRPVVDQYGQYGIGGADWKLHALWHNWHKVDLAQAMLNIIQNQLEDKLYGMAYRSREALRPRNVHRRLQSERTQERR